MWISGVFLSCMLQNELIMSLAMIICYGRDLVIFRDLLVCFSANYVAYVDIMHMLWFFMFSVSRWSCNIMFMVWLRLFFNSSCFGILYAIFGGLCTEFWFKFNQRFFLSVPVSVYRFWPVCRFRNWVSAPFLGWFALGFQYV